MGEMASGENGETVKGLKWLKGCVDSVMDAARDAKKLGEDDPRRVIHSFKVGLAIVVVSLFYYFDFLYDNGFGVSAMWAVMTVVFIFDFSVGATLGKSINRGIATLLGGTVGVAAHKLATFAGERAEPVILAVSIFLTAAVFTYMRFFPKIKARYDYGLVIFILTFCLITVSGYREDVVLDNAHKRLSTVLIGTAITVLICTFIYPVWAGEDFHKLAASNLEKLGMFLEGFGQEFLCEATEKSRVKKTPWTEYKSVLNSKGIEDSLVSFAKWEPMHGKFRYRHPWDQYLKVGSLTRECAYKIDALSAYLNSDVHMLVNPNARIQEQCEKMSSDCGRALTELSVGINTMTRPLSVDFHLVNAKKAVKTLEALLKTSLSPDTDLLNAISLLTVASLLIDIVSCTVKIVDSVHELASLSKFKNPDKKTANQMSLERVERSPTVGSHNFNVIVE